MQKQEKNDNIDIFKKQRKCKMKEKTNSKIK